MSGVMPEAEVAELLRDVPGCPRLTDWERGFVQSINMQRLPCDGAVRRPYPAMSEKQSAVLRRIQEKVYAV